MELTRMLICGGYCLRHGEDPQPKARDTGQLPIGNGRRRIWRWRILGEVERAKVKSRRHEENLLQIK